MGILIELGFVILLLPLIALCAFLYFFIRCAFQPKGLTPSFLFPDKEGRDLEETLSQIEEAEEEIERIGEEGRDLERRSDGLFDGRSALGRRLNKVLGPAHELLEAANNFRDLIEESAQERLDTWNFNRIGRSCSAAALVVYGLAALISSFFYSGFAILVISGLSSAAAIVVTFVIKTASCENDISAFMPTRAGRTRSGDDDRSEDDEGSTSSHDGQKQSARKKDCFEILGLRPGASGDEIKSAYRDAIKQYHPDYVVNLGPELREVAERKTKELNAAYSEALSHQAKKSGGASR
jgi:hypothetical protein